MATNKFFTTHSAAISNEQNLMEDLIVEAVKVSGIDVYYIPRTSDIDLNNILGEQSDSRLSSAYPIECFLVNFEGYDGENEFMSKLGFEMRASTNIIITARSFREFVGIYEKPREGDLIYIPMLEKLFEIVHSDPDSNFHVFGRRESRTYFWELRIELFKYSQENIDTGIEDIDIIEDLNSYSIQLNLGAGSGNYVIGEEVYQGSAYITANSTAKVADWNFTDKILTITDIVGSMNASVNVVGVVSGTSYTVSDYDELEDHVPDDISDNDELNTESENLIDDSETNPLT